MGIPAQRFQFLDDETNIGISDFFNGSNTDIMNSPINELKNINPDIEAFITNALQNGELPLPTGERNSTDLLANLKDLSSLDAKGLLEQVKELFPDNPISQSLFSQLSTSCKGRALGRNGGGKPYGRNNSCNGSKRPAGAKCGSSSKAFGGAMKSYTNGAYDFQYNDLDKQYKNLTAMSSMGYDMNMCGVFSSLMPGVPQDMLSKASGQLVSTLTSSKNIVGLFDLSSASAALKTKLFNPATITSMLSSFTFPSEIRERDSSSLSDRFTGAMGLFDNQWSSSQHDQILSTQGVRNPQMRQLMQRKALDNIYDQDHLDVAPTDDFSFLSVAF